MAPLPFIKIFIVLFKEAAKPIAARLKQSAKEHERFRSYTIVIGRAYERATQRIEVWSLGFRVKQFKEITEAHALTVGADIISQTFLISVALLLLLLEYWRGNNAAAAAAAVKQSEKAARQAVKSARLLELEKKVGELAARIAVLESQLAAAPNQSNRDQSISSADGSKMSSPRSWFDFFSGFLPLSHLLNDRRTDALNPDLVDNGNNNKLAETANAHTPDPVVVDGSLDEPLPASAASAADSLRWSTRNDDSPGSHVSSQSRLL